MPRNETLRMGPVRNDIANKAAKTTIIEKKNKEKTTNDMLQGAHDTILLCLKEILGTQLNLH